MATSPKLRVLEKQSRGEDRNLKYDVMLLPTDADGTLIPACFCVSQSNTLTCANKLITVVHICVKRAYTVKMGVSNRKDA